VLLECLWHAKGRFSQSADRTDALIILVSLVELIVLNVGLQAKILDQRVFSMFVLHALVLTFITTPLTVLIYPSRYRVPASTALEKPLTPSTGAGITSDDFIRFKFSFVLDCIEQLPSAMTLAQLLQRPSTIARSSMSEKTPNDQKLFQSETSVIPKGPYQQSISIDTIRLVELTERTSAVLKSQAADTLLRYDPVLSVFRTFGRLNHFSMSTSLSVINYDEFSTHVTDHARQSGSQMVVVSWPLTSLAPEASTSYHAVLSNPFDSLFSKTPATDEGTSLLVRSQFIRKVFANSPSDVALFIDRGLSTDSSSTIQPHVFLPFFGGPDDRLALSFVIQLCMHEGVSATVVQLRRLESDGNESVNITGDKSVAQHGDVRITFVPSDNT
jgi:hypothetical protein